MIPVDEKEGGGSINIDAEIRNLAQNENIVIIGLIDACRSDLDEHLRPKDGDIPVA